LFVIVFQLWQAFVGVKARRVEKYYQDLLASESDSEIKTDQQSLQSIDSNGKTGGDFVRMPEKWKGQIEKVFAFDVSTSLSTVILSYKFLNRSLTFSCMCRICLEHFLVILLWMRMVETL